MCKNIYLAGLCKTIGELYARKNHTQTPTHMQVQESLWVRQRVGPCHGESLPVPQGWIPLYTRDSRKGSETPTHGRSHQWDRQGFGWHRACPKSRPWSSAALGDNSLCTPVGTGKQRFCSAACTAGCHQHLPLQRSRLTLAPSPWTFPLGRSLCGQQEGLSTTVWRTWEPFPISPALSKVFNGFLFYEDLFFLPLLSVCQFFSTAWLMTIFLNKVQYQWHSDSVNTARVHPPELFNIGSYVC